MFVNTKAFSNPSAIPLRHTKQPLHTPTIKLKSPSVLVFQAIYAILPMTKPLRGNK